MLKNQQVKESLTVRKSKEDFLNSIVIPSAYGSLNKKVINAIYGLNNKLIFATNFYAKMLGFDSYTKIVGKNHYEIDGEFHLPQHAKLIPTANHLRNKVIELESIIGYAEFVQYNDKFHVNTVTNYPIFYPDGSVIAVGKIARPLQMFLNPKIYLDLIEDIDCDDDDDEVFLEHSLMENLTQRQEEVLYLLMLNFSQKQIAKILKINRGSVSSHITLLCEKFKINGQSTPLLVQRAHKMGFLNHVPASLFKANIFLLSHENLPTAQTLH